MVRPLAFTRAELFDALPGPITLIAARLGVSRWTVRDHLEQLERDGHLECQTISGRVKVYHQSGSDPFLSEITD